MIDTVSDNDREKNVMNHFNRTFIKSCSNRLAEKTSMHFHASLAGESSKAALKKKKICDPQYWSFLQGIQRHNALNIHSSCRVFTEA